jgi:outer membrane protein assembly factor BamB
MQPNTKGPARLRAGAGLAWSLGALLAWGAVTAGDSSWTQWGGPDRSFVVEAHGLAERWPEAGPRQLWSREIGAGYSGAVVADGRLYTMYRDGQREVVVAINAATGKTLWQHAYEAPHYKNQTDQFGGGPNATPLLVGDRLFTVGFTSKLLCLETKDGKVVWSHDLVEEFGGQKLDFGYSASPLLHDGTVIVLVGGERHGALGFDPGDGSVRWKSEALEISYASPRVVDVDGQKQLVFMTPTEVVGVDLRGGGALWRHPHENQYRNNCAGPWWGDSLLFVSSQGDAGSRTLKLVRREGKTVVEEVARARKMRVFHNTAVRRGDWLYAGSHETVVAHNVRTGETAWKKEGFPEANLLLAGNRWILLDETGRLALASLTPEKLVVHSSVQVLEKPAWTAPALAGSHLFLRGKGRLVALDIGAAAAEADRGR